ncbi:MAG TPA: hypothetical protein VI488_15990, partial [Candidatus Angelobacter sp.]
MAERRPVRKITARLVTASGAAVLAVYTAGYLRTEKASEQFVRRVAERRVASISARVASVRDGLDAKVTVFPGGLPMADRPAGAAPAAPKAWKDGRYTGWGFSPHGNIEAAVTIEGGRI